MRKNAMLEIYKLKKNKQTSYLNSKQTVNSSFSSSENEKSEIRHYVPANKEWFNSIYAYNKDNSKLLVNADKVVLKLIKSYFNLYSKKLESKIKFRYVTRRLRKLSTNRILVSRPELKHTSDKVNITIYLYNRQKTHLLNKIKNINTIFSYKEILLDRVYKLNDEQSLERFEMKRKRNMELSKKILINVKEKVKKIMSKVSREKKVFKKTSSFTKKTFSDFVEKPDVYSKRKQSDKAKALLFFRDRENRFTLFCKRKGKQTSNFSFRDLSLFRKEKKTDFRVAENKFLRNLVSKSLDKEILALYYQQILFFNKSKLNKTYLAAFTKLIESVYKKNVDFNLVNLKYLYLNSYIFTDTIVKKLKNKKNKLLNVLKASLLKFKVPVENKLATYNDIYNKSKYKQNLLLKDFSPEKIGAKDILQEILEKVSIRTSKTSKRNTLKDKKDLTNEDYCKTIVDSIKYKSVSGLRIEAAGRLTRRYTAARSVFKLRYKGNIRNIDSSYKGLSSVLLRGYAKSNVQYTKLKSNLRIGSYGIKGWVSSD